MWKNKHVILAMLIAPVLAIIAWFSVDYFVAERPHEARPGASYPLVAKPNCRRLSERCDLVNEDFRLGMNITYADYGDATLKNSQVRGEYSSNDLFFFTVVTEWSRLPWSRD